MFFIMGVTPGSKEISYNGALMICDKCGRYGRYQIFMTYMCLSLFFIPTFKWNRRYYVKSSCCGTVYELDPETGKRLARGEQIVITPDMLTFVRAGNDRAAWQTSAAKRCPNCGYETTEDFEYCPKCGRRF